MTWNTGDLESVNCDLCGGKDARPVFTRPDGLIAAECPVCGLCYITPRPKAELVPRFYQPDYFTRPLNKAAHGNRSYVSEANRLHVLAHSQRRLALTGAHFRPAGKRCLEVGCATGEFCHVLSEAGATTLGLDIGEVAIAHARQRYPGLEFRTGPIEALPTEEQFDAIFAFEVIEHVLSPRDFLTRLISHLRPTGKIVFSTPNYACGQEVGPDRWLGFLSSFDHLYFLSPAVLARYAERQGLTVEAWYTWGDGVMVKLNPGWIGKRVMRHALTRLGLLAHRTLGRRPASTDRGYVREGNNHNLVMVLSRL